MFMYEGISYGEKCTAVSVEDGRHCRNRFYFIRHLLIHQIFLVKWFSSFEKTIRCKFHCQESQITTIKCNVMIVMWCDDGTWEVQTGVTGCAPLLPCTWPPWQCYHSAPVVSCNGRHNCLTTKPNWPWLAAWLPTVPRKYRCRRGVVWWRDAAAGSRLGSCEGVTQNIYTQAQGLHLTNIMFTSQC